MKIKMKRISKNDMILLLIFSGCGGISIGSDIIPVNPAYILTVIGISLFFITKKILNYKISKEVILYFAVFLIFYLLSFILNFDKQTLPFIFNIFVFLIAACLGTREFFNQNQKRLNSIITAFICFGFIDVYYRFFMHGFSIANILSNFYNFKVYSFMYDDTNYVGNFFALLYIFLLDLNFIKVNRAKKIFIIFFVLLSFSRGAILTVFICILTKKIKELNSKIKKLVISLLSLPLIVGIVVFVKLILKDNSLLLRLSFIHEGILKFFTLGIKMFFGLGFTNSKLILDGHYAHNIFLLLLIEKGILGLIVFFSLIFYCFFKYKELRIFILCFLLMNSVTAPYYHSLFFFTLGITLKEIKRSKLVKEEDKNNV